VLDNENSSLELSIVSPVYGAESSLRKLYETLSNIAQKLSDSYEIVLVEDCSPDNSWEVMKELATSDPHVKIYRLTRNFGQQIAIAACLTYAIGKRTVVIDCDLQDQAEKIVDMWHKMDEGADIVYTLRLNRKDSVLKRFSSWIFYTLMGFSKLGFLRPGIGTFSMISEEVKQSYLRVADEHSLYVAVLHWLGYNSEVVEQEHSGRDSGRSGYSFRKLVFHALNGLISQTNTLLYGSIAGGFLLVLAAFAGIIYLILQKITSDVAVDGWASLAVLNLAVGGTVLLALGILGLYLGRIFERVKNRPLFLARNAPEINNANSEIE